MATNPVFEKIESYGIDFERFHKAFSQSDNWGGMVHAFEYVTILGVVESLWAKELEEREEKE